MTEPSLVKVPLITARRLAGSSCHTIPEIFNRGGEEEGPLTAAPAGILAIPGDGSTFSKVAFRSAIVSATAGVGALVPAWVSILGGSWVFPL